VEQSKTVSKILRQAVAENRDIEVRNPERASDDTHYHVFFLFTAAVSYR
jgi:hypothetical protein